MNEQIIAEAICKKASDKALLSEVEMELSILKLTDSPLYRALENVFSEKNAA